MDPKVMIETHINNLDESALKSQFFQEMDDQLESVTYQSAFKFLDKFAEKESNGYVEIQNYIRLSIEPSLEDYLEYELNDEE